LDVRYSLQGQDFEWDAEKARTNREDHGVSFEEAAEVFFDPFHQGGDASRNLEAREFLIGYSESERLLLVVYIERSTTVRIISAWPATRSERILYEQA
jgi:uncharacterized protein